MHLFGALISYNGACFNFRKRENFSIRAIEIGWLLPMFVESYGILVYLRFVAMF